MRKLPLLLVSCLSMLGCSDTDTSDGSGGSGGATSGTMATSGTGATGTASTSSGATSSTTTGSAATTSTGSGMDPFAAARAECISKINELRATKGLPAYGQWASGESCADQQATSDEASNSPHGAFGMCGENAQNECLGAGPGGISSCLDAMWNEKNQAGCAGCDACANAYNPNCPNCDFFGQQTGDVCGHYVNMSALYLSEAACGFSSGGGWDVINFR